MVVGQDDFARRQIRTFIAHIGKECLLDTFADEQLLRCMKMFPGAEWEDYVDPAGAQRTGLTLMTYHDILRSKGVRPKFKKSSIEVGLSVIEEVLNSSVKGRPVLLFSPNLCKPLIKAFHAGYCNEKDKVDDSVNPVKDSYYDHIMDAFRYAMIHIRKAGEPITQNRQVNRGNVPYTEEAFSPRGIIQVGQRQGNGFNKSRMY